MHLKELFSFIIWGCALLRDLSRARLAVDILSNSHQCIGRRNKTTIQRVWWLCAKPLSGHHAQGWNSSLREFALLLPKSVGAACLHCKAEHLTKKQRYISAEKSFLCFLQVLFVLFFFFFNKPAKLRDIEKIDIGWNPGSTEVIGKIPIDFPRVSFHLQYGPVCILSWWHPNKMCFAYKSKHGFGYFF